MQKHVVKRNILIKLCERSAFFSPVSERRVRRLAGWRVGQLAGRLAGWPGGRLAERYAGLTRLLFHLSSRSSCSCMMHSAHVESVGKVELLKSAISRLGKGE